MLQSCFLSFASPRGFIVQNALGLLSLGGSGVRLVRLEVFPPVLSRVQLNASRVTSPQ